MSAMDATGELGELWYLHSQRVNLGRIQSDINALWSIGPHDISRPGAPELVQAGRTVAAVP
jgi:hypothetical protein